MIQATEATKPTGLSDLGVHAVVSAYNHVPWYPDCIQGLLPGVSGTPPNPGYRVEDQT